MNGANGATQLFLSLESFELPGSPEICYGCSWCNSIDSSPVAGNRGRARRKRGQIPKTASPPIAASSEAGTVTRKRMRETEVSEAATSEMGGTSRKRMRNLLQDRDGKLRRLANTAQADFDMDNLSMESTKFAGPKKRQKSSPPCTKETFTLKQLHEAGYQTIEFKE